MRLSSTTPMPVFACYTLSRLKGMETLATIATTVECGNNHLLYTFPFEGNGNSNGVIVWGTVIDACYTLSRLKGMETQPNYIQV